MARVQPGEGSARWCRRITLDLSKRSNGGRRKSLAHAGERRGKSPSRDDVPNALPVRTIVDDTRPVSDSERPPQACRRGDDTMRASTCARSRWSAISWVRRRRSQECTSCRDRQHGGGQGYLIGCRNIAQQRDGAGDCTMPRLGEGDVARVLLPFRISAQVHGIWAGSHELPLT